jgi:hypothetical protein
MTSQIDRADNNPMAHEDDQAVRVDDQAVRVDDQPAPADDLAMPADDLALPADDLAMPADDLALPADDLAMPADDLAMPADDLALPAADDLPMPADDLAMPADDLALHDEPVSHGFATWPAANSEPAASAISGFPGFTPDGNGAGQPGMGIGSPDYVASSPTADAAASSVYDSPPADNAMSGGSPPADNAVSAATPWKEIQATFVDDPRASTERAAGLVDDRVQALVTAVRNRQRVLESAWQAGDAGTEELRTTLQHYRAFWHRLEDFPTE